MLYLRRNNWNTFTLSKKCEKRDCISRYFKDGLNTSLLNEIFKKTSKCDLLFSLYSISNYSDFNFVKPPPLFGRNGNNMLSNDMIDSIIKCMPKMSEMIQKEKDSSLKELIGDIGYYVLNWTVLTCRLNLIQLPKTISFLRNLSCSEIFMNLPYSCDQEYIFNQMKYNYQSKFLWFGCPTDRWHTIFRHDLTNLNVAQIIPPDSLYDDGIYLTDKSDIACAFSKPADNKYANSSLPKNLQLIALCEVISLPQKNLLQK